MNPQIPVSEELDLDRPGMEQVRFVSVSFDAICPKRDQDDITPERIRAETRAIQENWSENEREYRATGRTLENPKHWAPPNIATEAQWKDVFE